MAAFLDSLSLYQLALVSQLMRQVCSSLLQDRGMVTLLWEKKTYSHGGAKWRVKQKVGASVRFWKVGLLENFFMKVFFHDSRHGSSAQCSHLWTSGASNNSHPCLSTSRSVHTMSTSLKRRKLLCHRFTERPKQKAAAKVPL